jgi:formylglycine-generating enzyme required for sulfatase activity
MLRIPAGRFLMGSPEQESGRDPGEGPVHAVELEEFLLASTPITQAQWRQVARWEPPAGAAWQSPLPLEPSLSQGSNAELLEAEPDSAQRPVERISWAEAMEFCRRLSQGHLAQRRHRGLRQVYMEGGGSPAQQRIEQHSPGLAALMAMDGIRA